MRVAVLPCSCGRETLLGSSTLKEISTERSGLARSERFACILCSGCKMATQWRIADIRLEGHPLTDSAKILAGRDLELVFLRCAGRNCAAHIKVHVPPSIKTDRRSVKDWNLSGLTCFAGHSPRLPPVKCRSDFEHMKWLERFRKGNR